MTLAHACWRALWRMRPLPLRWKKSVYKRLCTYETAPDAPFVSSFFGLQYHGNLNNNIEFNIYYFGAFEKPLLFFLRDCLQGLRAATVNNQPLVFADIGANIGQHSLFMSQVADQVYAFEPYDPVRERLEYHLRLNQISNIQVYPVGLSAQDEELPFYAPTGRNQGIGSFDSASVSKGNKPVGKLRLVNGDAFFVTHGLLPPSLLKIDVEGFEQFALSGLRQTLLTTRPILVTEITYGKELSFKSREQLLEALPPEYQLFAFNTRKQDGSKARKRGGKAKRSGAYELIEFTRWLSQGQDDVVACPVEKLAALPRIGPARET